VSSKKTKWRAAFLVIYALSVGGIALRAQTPVEVGRRDQSLPDGEGKELILGTCTQCHSLGPVVLQRKSAAGWEHTVRDMISRGAQIHSREIAPMVSYLAQHFGPGVPPLTTSSEKQAAPRAVAATNEQSAVADLPEGPAKALILRSCTECHGLDRITDNRKTEAGWQASVKDMIRLGAKLTPEELPVAVAYLVEHFGPAGSPANVASSTPERTPKDPSRLLPDGEGKGLVLATCVQCHNLRYVVELRKDAAGWRHTVQDMISRGAQLTAAEADLMTDYLARYLSTKTE
jgi:mono/diheme cytochrome c family protein